MIVMPPKRKASAGPAQNKLGQKRNTPSAAVVTGSGLSAGVLPPNLTTANPASDSSAATTNQLMSQLIHILSRDGGSNSTAAATLLPAAPSPTPAANPAAAPSSTSATNPAVAPSATANDDRAQNSFAEILNQFTRGSSSTSTEVTGQRRRMYIPNRDIISSQRQG